MGLKTPSTAASLLALLALATTCACKRQAAGDLAEGQTPASISLSSSSFGTGDKIPQKYSCDGGGVSPNVHLSDPPSGTKSLLLVMDDPDASGFVHWLVYNIPPSTRDIPEGALPSGAAEGNNSVGNTGYFGPCPPAPDPHHYIFRLYALDTELNLPAGQTRKEVAAAVKGHILAEGRMTGLYTRGGG